MTYIYDIGDASDISSQMRLELGDNREDPDGILPEGKNFSDEELDYFYDQESDNFWLGVARAFESAAARWSAYPSQIRLGPESQTIPAAKYYAQRAKDVRAQQVIPTSISISKVDYGIDTD